MGFVARITALYSDDPVALLGRIASAVSRDGARPLVFSSSKFRADKLAGMSSTGAGGRSVPGAIFTTLNAFADGFPDSLLADSRRTISLEERYAAVFGAASISRDIPGGYESCKRMAAAISELKTNGVFLEDYKKRSASISGDRKYALLGRAFAAYERVLASKGLRDYEDKLYEMAFSKEFSKHIADSFNLVVFDSPERMSRLERMLAARVVASVHCSIFSFDTVAGEPSPAGLSVYSKLTRELVRQGVETEIDRQIVPPHRSAPLFESTRSGGTFFTRVASEGDHAFSENYKSRADEVEAIARAIKSISSRTGDGYGNFCVYIQDFEKYSRHFLAAFDKYGIPYASVESEPISRNVDSYPIVSALKFLKSPSAETFVCMYFASRPALFDRCRDLCDFRELKNHVLRSRVFDSFGDARLATGSIRRYAASLRSDDPASPLFYHLEKFFSSYFSFARPEYESLESYFRSMCVFFSESGFRPGGDGSVAAYLIRTLGEFASDVSRYYPKKIGYGECSAMIYSAALEAVVPPSLDPHGFSRESFARENVLVMSRDGAKLVRPDYLFIAGLVDGEFPRSGPESPSFFDHEARSALGIEAHKPKVTRERHLFHQLIFAAGEAVYLTRPFSDKNLELTPSRFLKEVGGFADGLPDGKSELLCLPDAVAAVGGRFGEAEFVEWIKKYFNISSDGLEIIKRCNSDSSEAFHERENSFYGKYNTTIGPGCGEILKLAFGGSTNAGISVSATALERFLNCPAAFYFQRVLGLSSPEKYANELDGMIEGKTVHSIIQKFVEDGRTVSIAREYKEAAEGGERDDIRKALEKVMLEAGTAAMDNADYKSLGEFYLEMKRFQYFNGLSGFSARGSGLFANDGLPGYFKVFVADYLERYSENDIPLEMFGTELAAETTIDAEGISSSVKLFSRCDLIEVWRDREKNEILFVVTDYKLSAVPQSADIKNFKKIQAPFYLFVLDKYLNSPGNALMKNNGGARFKPAGFVYESVTRSSGMKLNRTYYFDSAHADRGESGFRIITGKRNMFFAKQEFDKNISDTVSLVSDCLRKISEGEFHQSVLESQKCDYCDFVSICRRKESVVKRLAAGSPVRNNRIRIGDLK